MVGRSTEERYQVVWVLVNLEVVCPGSSWPMEIVDSAGGMGFNLEMCGVFGEK